MTTSREPKFSAKSMEEEYFKCLTQKDYENYFLKYRGTDNPFLERAKHQIQIRSRINIATRIIVLLFCLGLIYCIFQLVLILDGTTNEFLGLLGFVSIFLAIILFIFGIVVLYSPSTLYNLIKNLKDNLGNGK